MTLWFSEQETMDEKTNARTVNFLDSVQWILDKRMKSLNYLSYSKLIHALLV